jgi:hypothetical protein
VRRSHAPGRERAQADINACRVLVNGPVPANAGRHEAGRGKGIITDPDPDPDPDPVVGQRVVAEGIAAVRDRGATMMGAMVSPMRAER